jgi:hypothetical protein
MSPHRLPENPHIAILDMTTILAQVNGNAISTTDFGQNCRRHGIRFHGAARLANCGHMVDIDTQSQQS